MSKRTLTGTSLIVILVIIGIVVWAVSRPKSNNGIATAPVLSVSAFNQTQNKDATSASAAPQDIVIYALTAENHTNKVIQGFVIEANISQVTDKSTLIDAQGASYNSATNSLVWTPLDIPVNGSINKQFSVRVNPIPAGSTNTVMKIKYNNQSDVAILPPQAAVITTTNNPANRSNVPYKAPVTGADENLTWFLAFSATVGVFFISRNRKAIKN